MARVYRYKKAMGKGTLKHRLVSYVMKYPREYFLQYVQQLTWELDKRNIKYQEKYYLEIDKFCWEEGMSYQPCRYEEHNDRYLKQCLYNLEEKATRNIISKEEWLKIYNEFKNFTDLWSGD